MAPSSHSVIAGLPNWLEPYLAVVTAVLSVPFTFFISNDAFYFGILPILAKAGAVHGFTAAEIGRAALSRGGDNLWADLTARDVTGPST